METFFNPERAAGLRLSAIFDLAGQYPLNVRIEDGAIDLRTLGGAHADVAVHTDLGTLLSLLRGVIAPEAVSLRLERGDMALLSQFLAVFH